ncbi:hypothetical protein [Halorarius halobius]|uniref:hypothetical protein n=1 Tax=Halorarius halobius TaxID=2962671 RepID=UPI0020CD6450|nr:hypothetical protein [Halorarius halobius]
MERGNLMKSIDTGTGTSPEPGTVQASEHDENGDEEDGDSDSGDGSQGYLPYGGNDTKTENRFADSQTEMPGFPEAFA